MDNSEPTGPTPDALKLVLHDLQQQHGRHLNALKLLDGKAPSRTASTARPTLLVPRTTESFEFAQARESRPSSSQAS